MPILNPIIERLTKGAHLTFTEHDTNFTNLLRYQGGWDIADTPLPRNTVVIYQGGAWVALADTSVEPVWGSADWFPLAPVTGRGGMRMASPTAGTDIGAGWNPLTDMDTESLTPYGSTMDTTNGICSFQHVGLWTLNFNLGISHNNSNSGRTSNIRIVDNATGTFVYGQVPFGLGRNQEDTFLTIPLTFVLAVENVDTLLRFEIGGGDAITGVTYNIQTLSAVQNGVF